MARSGLNVLPVLLLALGAWMSSNCFANSPSPRATSRMAMQGFKDDFYAWKDTLSKEDQALLLKQAQNEFNKKFRATDDFKTSISEDKIESFGKVLQKFFDNEKEDYKKDVEKRTPDYDYLQSKAKQVAYDFSLTNAIVPVDRDGDRRWASMVMKRRVAEAEGKEFPDAAVVTGEYLWANEGQDHTDNVKLLEMAKAHATNPEIKKALDEFEIPADGEDFMIQLPRKIVQLLSQAGGKLQAQVEAYRADHSESEVEAYAKSLEEEWVKTAEDISKTYILAQDEIETEMQKMKKFFGSQKNMAGKTKADILKGIWKLLPKYSDGPVEPLDEEMLSELAKVPAVIEGEFNHSWGTADTLYKSEAIDSFGSKYLLGIFEKREDAEKAFDAWNKEYTQAGQDVKENLKSWAKGQEAELAEEQDSVDRIRKALEEAQR
ncbi:unnamed protein product [Durusdinium trenchii]|uniref:Tyrosyl-DNA phosphodiesterase 2 n=2 Tax=Durusdinium trenchii TaxID=1381693 RepID=A0ABP0QIU7_9DINO